MNIKAKLKLFLDMELHSKLLKYTKGHKKSIVIMIISTTISSLSSVWLALVTKQLIDYAMSYETTKAFYYGVLFAFILFFEMGMTSFITYYSVRVTEVMRNSIQLQLLTSVYGKKWLEINTYKTGDLLTRLYDDVGSVVTTLLSTIPRLIALLLQLFFAFGFLCLYDPMLAVLTFLVTPVTIIIGMFIGRMLKVVQKQIQEADALKRSIMNESLQNIVILKSFGFLNHNLSRVKNLQLKHFNLVKKKNLITIKSNVMLGLGYRLGFFGSVAFGAFRLAQKAISVGTFTAFIQLVGQIQGPIQGLAQSLPQLISTLSSVERIEEIFTLDDDSLTKESTRKVASSVAKVVFKDVKFNYTDDKSVLDCVNMTINRGEKMAIVGSSGEGKTTMIHLLLALFKPDSGQVTLEFESGEIMEVGIDTRQYFSYVPQTNTLFSGSILDNFLLQRPVAIEEIERAVIASCCKEFIDELPNGLDTLMGERGIGLSQGQAQRITIARALLHNTPFLVFDEATSSLDPETERQLIQNLKKYYPDCTLIAVTHQESIFDICDKVYKLKNGLLTIGV